MRKTYTKTNLLTDRVLWHDDDGFIYSATFAGTGMRGEAVMIATAKSNAKKLLSVLLAFALVLAFTPMSALGTETSGGGRLKVTIP